LALDEELITRAQLKSVSIRHPASGPSGSILSIDQKKSGQAVFGAVAAAAMAHTAGAGQAGSDASKPR